MFALHHTALESIFNVARRYECDLAIHSVASCSEYRHGGIVAMQPLRRHHMQAQTLKQRQSVPHCTHQPDQQFLPANGATEIIAWGIDVMQWCVNLPPHVLYNRFFPCAEDFIGNLNGLLSTSHDDAL